MMRLSPRYTPRLLLGCAAVLLALGPLVAAQEVETPARRALAAFQARFGDAARVRWDRATGYVQHIWGAPMETQVSPQTADDYEQLARELFDLYGGMFGVDSSQLELRAVKFLPLSRIDSSDKVAVVFDQVLDDLRVMASSAGVVFDTSGRILSVQSNLLADVDLIDPVPAVSAGTAHALAAERFGYGIEQTLSNEFRIVPTFESKARRPALAWVVHLRADRTRDGVPIQEMIAVDAHTGDVLWSRSTVHTVDLIGNTDGWATPGLEPDTGSNPPALTPLALVRMNSAVGYTDTLRNGDWAIPNSGSDPVQVTSDFGPDSTLAYVVNENGPELSLSHSVTPGVPDQFTFNQNKDEAGTAQVNGQDHVVRFRNYGRDLMGDTTMNFQQRCNVMINSTCNAYYDYSSTNFFHAGGSCPNTAYSTVISHETGHWANDRYNSGNGGDGFGEGNADDFAMFVNDTPIVAQDFFGPGSYIRSGWNSRQYCGSCGAGCYGEVHADGEVLMGAFWKWRDNLNATYGDAQGDLVADLLFLSWMNAYDDSEICDIIEEHLLVLDDDDGLVENGTPNFADIDAGFRAQGFPGIDLDQIFINHTPVAEQQGDGTSVTVTAQIGSLAGTITTARCYYSTDDGVSFVGVDLTPTGNPFEYSGQIPAFSAPEAVYYYIYAQDDTSYAKVDPQGSPDVDRYVYYVGTFYRIAEFDFDTGPSDDEGWTHTGTSQDDWERGIPQGKSTDPHVAYSNNVEWGNDLTSDGAYRNSNHLVLTSPVFDLSAHTGTRLQFRRWLGVEKGTDDQAFVTVNGTIVWQNPSNADLIDDHWTLQDIDVSAFADGNASVVVTFELVSDSSVTYGGWNIDDMRILAVESGLPGDCVEPANYGTGTAGSGGITPQITYSGGAPQIGNHAFTLSCTDGLGGATGLVFVGLKPDSRFENGIEYLVDTWVFFPVTFSGGSGVPGAGAADFHLSIPYNPFLDDLHFYSQFVISDPGGPQGLSASDGLETVICMGF